MIKQPYVQGTDFIKFTGAEAEAFVIFELMEKKRHEDDVKRIREDIQSVCKIHGIDGMKLIGLYSLVYRR